MDEPHEKHRKGLSLRLVVVLMFLVGILVSGALLYITSLVMTQYVETENAMRDFVVCQNDVHTVKDIIDVQSERARSFVINGDTEEVIRYFNEVQVEKSVDKALAEIVDFLTGEKALKQLNTAIQINDRMSAVQYHAMRLAVEGYGHNIMKYPPLLREYTLTEEELAMAPDEQLRLATSILFDKDYSLLKSQVEVRLSLCQEALTSTLTARHQDASNELVRLQHTQRSLIMVISLILLLVLLFVLILVINPVFRLVSGIQSQEQVDVHGSSEITFLAQTYNSMQRQMEDANSRLSYEAAHDSLTGLYNRSAYEQLRAQSEGTNIALLIVDIDFFKEVNDTYGHDIGDQVLQRVSGVLLDSFREADKVCRIGGDEFCIIMIGATSSIKEVIRSKIARASELLRPAAGEVPGITLSVGCAFADELEPGESIFKNADRALYRVKEAGRNGCGFYKKDRP